jgi:RimJ/RimL family protein N-acetyltransferase
LKVSESTPVLAGIRVRLRPVGEDDIALLLRWYSDAGVLYWLHASDRPPVTEEDVRSRFGPEAPSERELRWMIEAADGRTIGIVRLVDIDREIGRAELTIAIGEKEYWGKGYGTEAMGLAVTHGFEELALRRVYLITDADNERGILSYQKCGFRREGLLRAHRTRYGKPLDMMIMGVLREEWETRAG